MEQVGAAGRSPRFDACLSWPMRCIWTCPHDFTSPEHALKAPRRLQASSCFSQHCPSMVAKAMLQITDSHCTQTVTHASTGVVMAEWLDAYVRQTSERVLELLAQGQAGFMFGSRQRQTCYNELLARSRWKSYPRHSTACSPFLAMWFRVFVACQPWGLV